MNWTKYQPSSSTPWNLARVVHLHRRAGFGATWAQIQRDLKDGADAAIDRMLDGPTRHEQATAFQSMSENICNAAMGSNNSGRLRAWWFYHMLLSPDPLTERLTLMWHNHFATSNRKVEDLVLMMGQNRLLREHSRSSFGDLLSAALKDPAMLKWLDADANRKGHPNENLARELFELFALGIGNYNETDVLAAAKALTGWTTKDGEFHFRESRHDNSEIELFGKREKLDGDALLERTLAHAATPKRLAWRICKSFLGEAANTDEAEDGLAKILVENELHVGKTMETVLRSELFFSELNLRNRISGPAAHVLSIIHALELTDPPPSTMQLGEWSARMGQNLFHPPNVGGWNEGRAWLGSRSIIARSNFGTAVATGSLWRSRDADEMESLFCDLLAKYGVQATPEAATEFFGQLLMGGVKEEMVKAIVEETKGLKTEQPICHVLRLMTARPEYQLS